MILIDRRRQGSPESERILLVLYFRRDKGKLGKTREERPFAWLNIFAPYRRPLLPIRVFRSNPVASIGKPPSAYMWIRT